MGGRRPRPWYQPDACTLGSAPGALGLAQGSLSLAAVPTQQSRPSRVSECQILGLGRDWLLPFQGKVLAVMWGRGTSWGGPLPLGTRRISGLRASQASLGHFEGCWVREVTT